VKRNCQLLGLMGISAFLAVSGTAHAINFGGEYMTSWSGCSGYPNGLPASLSHTDDQINQWSSAMQGRNFYRDFQFSNRDVRAYHLEEDSLGGQDNGYADRVDMYALSSHGSVDVSNGYQRYSTPTCGPSANPFASSHRMSFAEKRWDNNVPTAIPNSGWARWIMLFTCYSVDTKANEQWQFTFWNGLDAVLGYRGLSADASTTEEVGADYVDAAWGDGDTIKAAWFWAIEDWAVDDTGAMISGGKDGADAKWRRDNLKVSSAKHSTTYIDYYYAWSWHEG